MTNAKMPDWKCIILFRSNVTVAREAHELKQKHDIAPTIQIEKKSRSVGETKWFIVNLLQCVIPIKLESGDRSALEETEGRDALQEFDCQSL
jgi:hypothetical protein